LAGRSTDAARTQVVHLYRLHYRITKSVVYNLAQINFEYVPAEEAWSVEMTGREQSAMMIISTLRRRLV